MADRLSRWLRPTVLRDISWAHKADPSTANSIKATYDEETQQLAFDHVQSRYIQCIERGGSYGPRNFRASDANTVIPAILTRPARDQFKKIVLAPFKDCSLGAVIKVERFQIIIHSTDASDRLTLVIQSISEVSGAGSADVGSPIPIESCHEIGQLLKEITDAKMTLFATIDSGSDDAIQSQPEDAGNALATQLPRAEATALKSTNVASPRQVEDMSRQNQALLALMNNSNANNRTRLILDEEPLPSLERQGSEKENSQKSVGSIALSQRTKAAPSAEAAEQREPESSQQPTTVVEAVTLDELDNQDNRQADVETGSVVALTALAEVDMENYRLGFERKRPKRVIVPKDQQTELAKDTAWNATGAHVPPSVIANLERFAKRPKVPPPHDVPLPSAVADSQSDCEPDDSDDESESGVDEAIPPVILRLSQNASQQKSQSQNLGVPGGEIPHLSSTQRSIFTTGDGEEDVENMSWSTLPSLGAGMGLMRSQEERSPSAQPDEATPSPLPRRKIGQQNNGSQEVFPFYRVAPDPSSSAAEEEMDYVPPQGLNSLLPKGTMDFSVFKKAQAAEVAPTPSSTPRAHRVAYRMSINSRAPDAPASITSPEAPAVASIPSSSPAQTNPFVSPRPLNGAGSAFSFGLRQPFTSSAKERGLMSSQPARTSISNETRVDRQRPWPTSAARELDVFPPPLVPPSTLNHLPSQAVPHPPSTQLDAPPSSIREVLQKSLVNEPSNSSQPTSPAAPGKKRKAPNPVTSPTKRARPSSTVQTTPARPSTAAKHAGTSSTTPKAAVVAAVAGTPTSHQPVVLPKPLSPRMVSEAKAHAPSQETTSAAGIYSAFQAAYPEFDGTLRRFVRACVYIEWLRDQKQAPHPFLWDDFIRAYSTDYIDYVAESVSSEQLPLTGIEFFNTQVSNPVFLKGVVGDGNLADAALLDESAATLARAKFKKAGPGPTALAAVAGATATRSGSPAATTARPQFIPPPPLRAITEHGRLSTGIRSGMASSPPVVPDVSNVITISSDESDSETSLPLPALKSTPAASQLRAISPPPSSKTPQARRTRTTQAGTMAAPAPPTDPAPARRPAESPTPAATAPAPRTSVVSRRVSDIFPTSTAAPFQPPAASAALPSRRVSDILPASRAVPLEAPSTTTPTGTEPAATTGTVKHWVPPRLRNTASAASAGATMRSPAASPSGKSSAARLKAARPLKGIIVAAPRSSMPQSGTPVP